MKELNLMTLNLHCFEEANIIRNQKLIVDMIVEKDIDIVFFQEVAQYQDAEIVQDDLNISNYVLDLGFQLDEKNKRYSFVYLPIKHSFNKYDEGVAILTRLPITRQSSGFISNSKDYENWKTRMYLKTTVKVGPKELDLYSVHTGWDDEGESYISQVERLMKTVNNKNTLIGGDFNIKVDSDYYNQTINMGLVDLYGINESKKYDYTFENELDVHKGSGRIDYIFATKKYKVLDQEIIFKDPMVSDHYGVYMKIQF